MKALRGLAFALSVVPACASSVTVTCNPPGETIVGTVDAQCSGQGDLGRTNSASASFSLNLANNPANFSVLATTQVTSAAIGGFQVPLSTSSTALTQINVADSLLTAGAVRPGYLMIQSIETSNSTTDGSGGHIFFGFSISGSNITAGEINCDNFGGCVPSNSAIVDQEPLIPITLGVPVTLLANGAVNTSAERANDVIESLASVQDAYEFRFVEVDGATPVAVSEVPEPSTALLVLVVLAATFLVDRQFAGKPVTLISRLQSRQ